MPAKKLVQRPAVLLALALCSVGGLVTLMGRLASGPQVEQKKSQVTTGDLSESYPALSPDGKRIAYSARESSKVSAYHVFVRELPSGKPLQLTKSEASDIAPVWAPDGGTLAFLRITDEGTQAIVIPADGGAERKIADLGPAADSAQPEPGISWNPDGKSLVVVQSGEKQLPGLAILTLDSAKLQRITNPTEGQDGDSTPVVSPSGSTIAFVRHTTSGADVFLCDGKGQGVRRLTFDDNPIRGVTWTRDEQDVMYSGSRVGGWHLWRVPAYGGSPRQFVMSGKQAYYPSIAKNRLVYADSPTVAAIWRATLPTDDAEGHAVIRTAGRERNPAWSPNGARIADISDQTGADEIFVSDADGQNRIQVTKLNGPRIGRIAWSPDSKTLLFDASSDHGQEVFTVPAVADGKPVRVLLRASTASFSSDGKSIYFRSNGQVWKATASGGNPQTLSSQFGVSHLLESVDGKWLYFRDRRALRRIPSSGGEDEEVFATDRPAFGWLTMELTKKGLYYDEYERSSNSMVVSFYDFAEKSSKVVFRLKKFNGGRGASFSVAPDGKSILYGRVDQSQTNVMLIDNFR